MREELFNQVKSLPAGQIKQAIMSWLSADNVEIPEELKSFLVHESENIGAESLARDINPANSESSFSETALYEEWSAAFQEWIDSHRGQNLPLLSDEAISRESIYYDERLL